MCLKNDEYLGKEEQEAGGIGIALNDHLWDLATEFRKGQ